MALSSTESHHAAFQLVWLSAADDFSSALEQWQSSGKCNDYGSPIMTCQLSDIEGYRFLFEISSETAGQTLWVSMECILALGISVSRDGQKLSAPRARAELERAVWVKRREACIVALMEHGMAKLDHALLRAISMFREHEALSPHYASLVFSILEREKIDHEPGFFRVFLRRKQDRQEIMAMSPWQVWRFWRAMTPEQQHEVRGHTVLRQLLAQQYQERD